ncbi:hypothetical protein NUU61_000556 [Penicillium alfredii]|uniref:Uncharacterized protein n=1 Tax=Penicillium alfredii TaxID=1506179 RepID=A0A9W9KR03_9EURO|nr:uncharacterized protein NUU61_000556 [Penicillium alfredii]KAJ5114797.1 hypothetical protein NUU61_000556 [Penicillium alfredii]
MSTYPDINDPANMPCASQAPETVVDPGVLQISENPQEPSAKPAKSSIASDISSVLTDVDDVLIYDPFGPPTPSQLITSPQILTPTAPRVSYSLSPESGLVEITEDVSDIITTSRPGPASPTANTLKLAQRRVVGPNLPFPSRIAQILKIWHGKYPEIQPPCSSKHTRASTWGPFRVFDRDGEEYDLSVYRITVRFIKRFSYYITILHSENGPEELVTNSSLLPSLRGFNHGSGGRYLVAWLDVEEKFESEACAIRVWGRKDDVDIVFSPQMFDNAADGDIQPVQLLGWDIPPANPEVQQGTRLVIDLCDESDDNMDISPSSPHTPYSPEHIRTNRSQNSDDPNKTPTRQSRKLHKTELDSGNMEELGLDVRRRLLVTPRVRFKMFSDTSGRVRYFPSEGCTVAMFFKRAKEFYKGVDMSAPFAVLCKVPGLEGIRYLGEGCEDEFRILLDDIKRCAGDDDQVYIVEVKPVCAF